VQKESKESRTRDEGRKEWEKLVFEPFKTDQMAIATYLRDIFGNNGTNKQAIKALDALRTSVEIFESVLATPGQFNVSVLKWVIQGLLASGVSLYFFFMVVCRNRSDCSRMSDNSW